MKLLHNLPEEMRAAVRRLAPKEKIVFALPANVDPEGLFRSGYTVVTEHKILSLGRGARASDITELTDYRAVVMVGNGALEARSGGDFTLLARYTMEYAPAYAVLARALGELCKGRSPKVASFDEPSRCPACGRSYPEGSRVCPVCLNKLAVFKRFSGFLSPYILHIIIAIVIFAAVTGISLLIPQLYRMLIDRILIPRRTVLLPLLLMVGAVGLSQLVGAALGIVRGRIMARIGNALSRDLRSMVYTKIQALSLGFLSRQKTGDLLNRVNNDTRRIQRFIEQAASLGINHLFIFAGITVLLFATDWRLALLVLLPVPFVVIFVRVTWNFVRRIFRAEWRMMDRANSLLQDILSGIRVVKAFGREKWEVGRFRKASLDVRTVTERNEKVWASITPFLSFVLGIGNFLVLYYGGRLVLGNELALGELVQFSEYARLLYAPLAWIGAIPKMFVEAMVAAERIFEVTDTPPEVADRGHPRHRRIDGAVHFDKVTFGYRTHEPVLDDVSLDVKPGEMIGLVGHSGAGKSTMINLLLRLYDVDEGVIRIDGRDLRDIALQDLRSQMGVVLQETFLFSGSVVENIRYARPDAPMTEIIQAAKTAHAHDFIVHFPDGYDTRVGEKGMRLSGGERQRIAIARAILHDPRILILDEATSSVDTETEEKIQDGLLHLVRNRTTFAIAHRLATLRHANRLVVLKEGKVVENGSHRELMGIKGEYYRLVMTQRSMSHSRGVSG